MAISFNGVLRVFPFANRGESDPLAALVGVASGAGDASGGAHSIVFTMPLDFVYVHLFCSWRSTNIAVAEAVSMTLLTGEAIGANNERAFKVTTPPVEAVLRAGDTFEPPKFIISPNVAPTWTISKANVNLLSLEGSFRSYMFPLTILRDIPLYELIRYSQ